MGAVFNHYGVKNSYEAYGSSGGLVAITDDISINFFGPALMVRNLNDSKAVALTAMLAAGYIWFVDDGSIGDINAGLTGSTVGLLSAVGGEVNLNTVLSIGFEVRNIIGSISSRKIEVGSQTGMINEDFDVSRFSIVGGFRLNL